jgi:hypothetical protein
MAKLLLVACIAKLLDFLSYLNFFAIKMAREGNKEDTERHSYACPEQATEKNGRTTVT